MGLGHQLPGLPAAPMPTPGGNNSSTLYGLLANRPAASGANWGLLYYASDTSTLYVSWQGTWVTVVSYVAPQITVYTAGAGNTYTTPAGCKYLIVELVGGGGGGAGSGTGATNGTAGADSTFGLSFLTAGGGGLGSASSATQVSGGISTGGEVNIAGGNATGAVGVANSKGGDGGVSHFGGNGFGGGVGSGGNNASANSGSGGGGGGCSSTLNAGGGGAAGGYCRKLITSPLASYSAVVGTGGSNGAAGTGGANGGLGSAGIVIVTAFFQ